MASFKNLVFITHPNSFTKGIMAKYRFDNGKEISIVAGDGLYSSPNSSVDSEKDVVLFEVMFDEEVIGWQNREDIDNIFKANQ